MSNDPLRTISAFLDGEDVGPDELATSLTAEGGREFLADAVLLRLCLERETPSPGEDFYKRMKLTLERPMARRSRLSTFLGTAAAFIAVAFLSFWIGTSGQVTETTSRLDPTAPPTPDKIIAYEPGVDWHEIK